MKKGLSFSLVLVIFFSCFKIEVNCQVLDCRESPKQIYFYKSFENKSTSPDFLVFTAVNKSTGQAKEICCESDRVFRAFMNEGFTKRHTENPSKEYNEVLELKPCEHTFEFDYEKSLEILGFNEYEYKSDFSDSLSKTINQSIIDSIIVDSINETPYPLTKYFKQPADYRNEIRLIHYLNSMGIYCGRNCTSGVIMIKKTIK